MSAEDKCANCGHDRELHDTYCNQCGCTKYFADKQSKGEPAFDALVAEMWDAFLTTAERHHGPFNERDNAGMRAAARVALATAPPSGAPGEPGPSTRERICPIGCPDSQTGYSCECVDPDAPAALPLRRTKQNE